MRCGRVRTVLLAALVAAGAWTSAEVQAEGREADTTSKTRTLKSTLEVWKETLIYGIDSEVLDTIDAVRKADVRSLTPELKQLLHESQNPDVQARVLELFGEQKEPAGTEEALRILESYQDREESLVRAAADYVEEVKQARGEQVFAALREIARNGNDRLAATAVEVLGKAGDDKSLEMLLEKLRGDATPEEVLNRVILALGELRAKEAVPALLKLLADTDAPRVERMYACTALGKIGDPAAIEELKKAFSERDALLRTYAAAALGMFHDKDVLPMLKQGMKDSNWKVRVAAVRAVSEGEYDPGGDTQLVPMLAYKAKRDPVKNVRLEAIRALGGMGCGACLDTLEELFTGETDTDEIREAAFRELLKDDLKRALKAFESVSSRETRTIRSKAVARASARLARVEDPAVEKALAGMLDSRDVGIRISAIRGIARNRFRDQVGRLKKLADSDPYPVVRREALSALEQMGVRNYRPASPGKSGSPGSAPTAPAAASPTPPARGVSPGPAAPASE